MNSANKMSDVPVSTETIAPNSRETILDAAEQLIALHGYAGLSMRELSKHSGIAKSTLYHHFQDKRAIYLSVLERDMKQLQRQLTDAAGDATMPLESRLQTVIETYLDTVLDRGIIALNALRRAGEFNEQVGEFFHAHRDAFLQPFRSILQDGIQQHRIRADLDVELAILNLVGMMNSFVAQRVLYACSAGEPEYMPPRDEIVQHTLKLYLHGVAKT